jgi:hypothetical protein
MNTLELETLGFYEPGFLHLRVNTDYDISDLNDLYRNKSTQKYFSTFLHEYIHFLQDVTTPSGLMSASFYIDFIKDVNWTIRNDGKPEFQVPVEISNENNIEANMKLRSLYRGEIDGSDLAKYDNYTIENEVIVDKEGNEKKPKKFRVYYYDLKTRERKNFFFGYACLKEYVAHTIQNIFIPSAEHPDIPYQIAEQIVNKEYPEFGNDPMKIVALCDASLMCFHPAEMFFNTIERMKVASFVPKSTKDVYDFAYGDLKFHGQIGIETISSLYEKIVEHTDKQFYDALQSIPFLPNYNWLKHILEKAKKLRLNHPNFMTELIESESQLSDLFFKIFKSLGTPFFTNNKEIGGFVPPNDLTEIPSQPYQLLVFKQIINVFNGHKCCSLYDFCSLRKDKNITNELCKTAPWERGTEAELCPFGQLWKTWGLNGEIPIIK